MVGPHTSAALCVRPGPDGGLDFVVSHEPDLVRAIIRMLMRRLDAAAERLDPPTAGRWTSPAVTP
nr:hypothetical protein GCM10020093_039740 [Planobispora longispora]